MIFVINTFVDMVQNKVFLDKRLTNGTYEIKECQYTSIKDLLLNNHYLKRTPAGILACFGIFNNENLGDVIGCAVFTNGRIQYNKKYIEFSRLWITDELGKNTESYFIAKCIKILKRKFKGYRGIVTWADTNIGHSGTVYLASNFKFDGMSRVVKKYIGKKRKIVYQRTADKNSIQIGEDKPKKRFIYYF